MAVKSELGEAGFDIFDEWSQRGDSYDQRATRDAWKSVKSGGKVTIATLFRQAKLNGWKRERPSAPAVQTPAQIEAIAKARKETEKQRLLEEAKYRDRADKAARVATEMWDAAAEVGSSPYLDRKSVKGIGVRYQPDGTLLVPLRNAAGELKNLQRIAPCKPTGEAPEKRFLAGGRKSGLWHWLGDPTGAPVLLLAEGYATAASLHEATGHATAVAFDAGNLPHVAKAIKAAHPAALIAICADDDRGTESATGANTGLRKAREAARAVWGVVAVPEGLPPDGTDFNDLAVHAGLEAVQLVVEAAIKAGPASTKRNAALPAPSQAAGAATQTDSVPAAWDGFTVDEAGVWFADSDREGGRRSPRWVCSQLVVTARTRDAEEAAWGYLLDFKDPAGHRRQWAMPARMLASDGAEYRATLLNLGLLIAPGPSARNLLSQYIQTRAPRQIATCTDRVGWHKAAFVLPRESLGDDTDKLVFQTDTPVENIFQKRGSLDRWKAEVAARCVGNSRLLLAACCAFAGPMLRPAGQESGGFHFRGDSSNGKTTALRVAASVWGGSNFLQRWRSTASALESTAGRYCDVLLPLDELAQVDPKDAGDAAYMLANEQGKARSNRNGQGRPVKTWRLLFLSAGEIGLAQHMTEGGKRARAGQELRMADVPADAGKGLGIFEVTHDEQSGAAFAQALGKACERNYGVAGRAWLEWAVDNAHGLRQRLIERVDNLMADWVPAGAGGQVDRVCRRFALVAAAGELATQHGFTGWMPGEASSGIRTCFDDWMRARPGGFGNSDDELMLRQVRHFLGTHGEGRFSHWERSNADDSHSPKTLNRAGFRKDIKNALTKVTDVEFFVLAETFRTEVCAGFDHTAVARVLMAAGHLEPEKGGRADRKERLPGIGMTRCYRIQSTIFDSENP